MPKKQKLIDVVLESAQLVATGPDAKKYSLDLSEASIKRLDRMIKDCWGATTLSGSLVRISQRLWIRTFGALGKSLKNLAELHSKPKQVTFASALTTG